MAVKDNYYFSIYNHGLEDILLANLAVLYWESAKHLTTVKLDVAFLLAIFEGGGRFVDISKLLPLWQNVRNMQWSLKLPNMSSNIT